MDLKLSPMVPPHPHPWRRQKSPARGVKLIRKNMCLMIFFAFYKKIIPQNNRWIIKKPKTILYWVLGGTNMGPYCPLPHPHPWRQQKSPARGQQKLRKNTNVTATSARCARLVPTATCDTHTCSAQICYINHTMLEPHRHLRAYGARREHPTVDTSMSTGDGIRPLT